MFTMSVRAVLFTRMPRTKVARSQEVLQRARDSCDGEHRRYRKQLLYGFLTQADWDNCVEIMTNIHVNNDAGNASRGVIHKGKGKGGKGKATRIGKGPGPRKYVPTSTSDAESASASLLMVVLIASMQQNHASMYMIKHSMQYFRVARVRQARQRNNALFAIHACIHE